MRQWHLMGWPADVTRASIVWILYVIAGLVTFVFAWITGIPGFALFIATLIFGPFAAAWLACRMVPADRPQVAILGAGIICGLIVFLILGFAVLKVVDGRHANATYVSIPVTLVTIGPMLGALTFSRLNRRMSA